MAQNLSRISVFIGQLSVYMGFAALIWNILNWFEARNRRFNVQTHVNIMDASGSYYTAVSFVNSGNIPATDVKVQMKFPAETDVMKIEPALAYDTSELENATVLEFTIFRIDPSPVPFAIMILTDQKPDAGIKVQVHESKAVKTLPFN